jgi:hypothetical protein
METITFTPELLAKLKREYKKAISKNIDTFLFEGNELLVSYTKYLIEYLETVFNKNKN